MYNVLFPNSSRAKEFKKQLLKLPLSIQDDIMKAVEALAEEPRPHGIPKIRPPISIGQNIAQYRIRIGNYRILYDIDDKNKIVWILALRLRNEKTYS